MLLFAMFTLGYFFGVFITLKVFGQKDQVEKHQPAESALISELNKDLSSWEIFTQLTKINYPIGASDTLYNTKHMKMQHPQRVARISINVPMLPHSKKKFISIY